MYAVGRLGSYITRGVSTVSGPFHPFGGAVDIVVVQQKDGSLKSSPWYVRFGKFQGVLKAKEKIVDINVNGVEADFHMYLNPRGEAYFLRKKMDSGEIDTLKLKSLDHNFDISNATAFSRNLGFVLDRKEVNDDSLLNKEDDSVKSAKIAAELLETKWCTTLSSITNNKNHGERKKDEGEVVSGKLETSLVLHEQHFVNNDEFSKKVDEVVVANVDSDGNVEIYEGHTGSLENGISKEERLKKGPEAAEEPLKVYTEVASNKDETCSVVSVKCTKGVDEKNEVKSCLESNGGFQDGSCDSVSKKEEPERFVEEQFGFSDLDDTNPSKSKSPNHEFDQESFEGDYEGLKGSIRRFASDNNIAKSCKLAEDEAGAQFKSLPNMCSGFDRFDPNNFDNSSYYSLDHVRRSSKWEILRKDASRIIKDGDEGSRCANALSKDLKDGKNAGNVSNIVDDTGKSWSLWPFTKSRSKKLAEDCKKDCDIDSGLEVDGEKEGPLSKSHKMQRALTPTPEQLQTLNLTEGKNTVTFTFSTAVLGNQQVDARIFLWKWDTRIVISDVDGTITKSDVLGQFMPLVGRDWSHIGVTHLFSAIKENGYQIIFLSARSISQADITRQFLFNLKQEGKALPDGPVVISPDGLFPSLFREVIRRAPHEFKIACLADIKACFPEDWNPFYAGFGNRDTDEFSYLKVGIPKGKIFIINPKGEVVNRSVDSKSYSSLHAIVNGIFPPISVHEESKGDNVVKEEKETNEQPGEPNSQLHMARDGSMSCSVSRSNV